MFLRLETSQEESPALSHKMTSYGIGNRNQNDEPSQLQRENEDLKLELLKARMQLKSHKSLHRTQDLQRTIATQEVNMNSMSKKLGRFNPFVCADSDSRAKSGQSRPAIGGTIIS